jgi:outer membrane receptor protein involved in Fe transport
MKPSANLVINVAAWYLHLDQEFVYVGDEGIVEPSGKSRRKGIDVMTRYQISDHLYFNANLNMTDARLIGNAKGEDYIPLAPLLTSTGGLYYKRKEGFNGGLSYRFIGDRPANEDNTIKARGYFIADGVVNYTKSRYEIGMMVENIFNSTWNEAQFATESRLKDEPMPVNELHYTPGTPFFLKVKFAVFF